MGELPRGPWKATMNGFPDNDEVLRFQDADGRDVLYATINEGMMPASPSVVSAIEALPDLLAVLKQLVYVYDPHDQPEEPLYRKARKLIAKIEGR